MVIQDRAELLRRIEAVEATAGQSDVQAAIISIARLVLMFEPNGVPARASLRDLAPAVSRIMGEEINAGLEPDDQQGEFVAPAMRRFAKIVRERYLLPPISRHTILTGIEFIEASIITGSPGDAAEIDRAMEAIVYLKRLYLITPKSDDDPEWLPEAFEEPEITRRSEAGR